MYKKAMDIIIDHSLTSGVPVSKIIGKGRTKSVVNIRRKIIKKIRKQTKMSTPEIGSLFDNRDHTTILHYLKT